jgi:hypothetical protein
LLAVASGVLLAAEVGVNVAVGVFVGRESAVWVNPAAKVLTAEVRIASSPMVGVGTGVLAPHALNIRLPTAARIIKMINLLVNFIFNYSFQ